MNFIRDEMEKLENDNINEFNKDIYIMKKNTLNNKIGTDDFNEKFNLTASIPQKTNYLSISMKNPSLASNGINNLKINKYYSFSRTLRKPLNYDKIINFNFGSQKPAKLKIISTSVLATNPSEKINHRLSIKNKVINKTSTFKRKAKKK